MSHLSAPDTDDVVVFFDHFFNHIAKDIPKKPPTRIIHKLMWESDMARCKGDYSQLPVDYIVNGAHSWMLPGEVYRYRSENGEYLLVATRIGRVLVTKHLLGGYQTGSIDVTVSRVFNALFHPLSPDVTYRHLDQSVLGGVAALMYYLGDGNRIPNVGVRLSAI